MEQTHSFNHLRKVYELDQSINSSYTHVFQGTIVRLTSDQIHIIRPQPLQNVSQCLLNSRKMVWELQRCSLVANSNKIEMTLAHDNNLIVIFSTEQGYFLAQSVVNSIQIQMSLVFESPIVALGQYGPMMQRMLSMKLAGYKLVKKQKQGKQLVCKAMMVFFDLESKELRLFQIKIESGISIRQVYVIRQQIGLKMDIFFVEQPNKFNFYLVSQCSLNYFVHQRNQRLNMQRWVNNRMELMQPPFLFLNFGPTLVLAKNDQQQMVVFFFKRDEASRSCAKVAQIVLNIKRSEFMIRRLWAANDEITFALFSSQQVFVVKKDAFHQVKQEEIELTQRIADIHPFSFHQIAIFYQNSFQIMPVFAKLNLSLTNSLPNSQPRLESIHSLTYSDSNSAHDKSGGSSLSRRQKQLFQRKKGALAQSKKAGQSLTKTSPEASPKAQNKEEGAQRGRNEKMIMTKEQKIEKQNEQKIDEGQNVGNRRLKQNYNRISQAIVQQAQSEDEGSSVDNSGTRQQSIIDPISASPHTRESEAIPRFGTFTPPEITRRNNDTTNLLSFGMQDLKRQNSQKSQEEIISFNPNDIKQLNAIPKELAKEKSKGEEKEEYFLPVSVSRTVSFGEEGKKINSFGAKEPIKKEKVGSLTAKREKSEKYVQILSKLKWRMNEAQQLLKGKNQLIQQLRKNRSSLNSVISSFCFENKQKMSKIANLKEEVYGECSRHSIETQTCQNPQKLRQKLNLKQMELQTVFQRFNSKFWENATMLGMTKSNNSAFRKLGKEAANYSPIQDRLWKKLVDIKLHILNLQFYCEQTKQECKKLKEKRQINQQHQISEVRASNVGKSSIRLQKWSEGSRGRNFFPSKYYELDFKFIESRHPPAFVLGEIE